VVPAGTSIAGISASNPGDVTAFCSNAGSCDIGTLGSSNSATVTVTLKVNASFSAASFTHQAHVSASERDPNSGNNLTSVTTNVSSSATLAISKSGPAQVTAGEIALYQINVSNNGPSDAQTVVITDSLPANTSFVAATPGCLLAGGIISCPIGTMAAGASASALIQLQIDPAVVSPTAISNTAFASADVAPVGFVAR